MGTSNIGLIGRKVGMTLVFQDDGTMVAVSVLAIEIGQRFAIREGGRTVGAGAIVSIVE